MGDSLISVIVPCFNQSETIIRALDSVLAQTLTNWECIVVNDGSTDDSQAKIEEFIQNDSRFKLKYIQNSGVSVARNTAVLHAQGDYLFPLDGDDYLHIECLKRCLSEFERDPAIKLVCPQGQMFGSETGLWILPRFDYKTMLKYNMIHNSSLFLRKDFDRVGGYRTNMVNGLEDWDFLIALLYGAANEQVIKTGEPLFYYRVKDSGRRLTAAANGFQKDMLDLLIYNNFFIYKEYFPDIFGRIHEYDYNRIMLNKPLVKLAVRFYNKAHQIKMRFMRSS